MEEDKYLGASALGSDMASKKKFIGRLAYLMMKVSTYITLVGT
jgi:hypothetical protein